MTAGLAVPVLPAGPFRLRPFTLGDTGVVHEAVRDPYIPLITTVPAASGRAVGQIGLWLRDVGGERKDFDLYAMLSGHSGTSEGQP